MAETQIELLFNVSMIQKNVLSLAVVVLAVCGCVSSTKVFEDSAQCIEDSAIKLETGDELQSNQKAFLKLQKWIKQSKAPIVSLLISKNGELEYQYYSSVKDKEIARNVMSVTKSVVSGLVGIATDKGFVSSPEDSISKYFPETFSLQTKEKFLPVSIKNVMSMSALSAKTWPKVTPEAHKMTRDFHLSSNRFIFAAKQDLLQNIGTDFEYTDVTPALISGALQTATGKNLFEFANTYLFEPLNFKQQGWLFRDKSGYDMASYGLELRPIDMHKFGVLYLKKGCWKGRRLISEKWIEMSLKPIIKSHRTRTEPDYGWFWWQYQFDNGWIAHLARGWHGQRLVIIPEQGIVISITADANDANEEKVIRKLFDLILEALAANKT